MAYRITVNGKARTVDAEKGTPLLWVLRDTIGLRGTKFGCGCGLCGCCTVQLDGKPARACQTAIETVGAKAVTTIEGIGDTEAGKKIQAAWVDIDVPQCGYCQAGQIMSASALLAGNPKPTDADIDRAMSGNICRCATYNRIRAAIHQAAGQSVTGMPEPEIV
jgi:isoquinoline 1-oxidoreductase alpha subunit